MNKKEFADLAEGNILFLDGALGTNMVKKGMPRNICVEAWLLAVSYTHLHKISKRAIMFCGEVLW